MNSNRTALANFWKDYIIGLSDLQNSKIVTYCNCMVYNGSAFMDHSNIHTESNVVSTLNTVTKLTKSFIIMYFSLNFCLSFFFLWTFGLIHIRIK